MSRAQKKSERYRQAEPHHYIVMSVAPKGPHLTISPPRSSILNGCKTRVL